MSELVNSQTEFMDPQEFIPKDETPYFELKRLSRSKDFIEVSHITGADRNIKHLNALANALELEILPDLKILNLQTKELYFFNEYFEGEETLFFNHSVTVG